MMKNAFLHRKLAQYSLTVKGQTTTGRAAAELAGYAAAAGAAMAMAGAADAAIIYSGIQNISVQINPNGFWSATPIPIDIDGDYDTDIIAVANFNGYFTPGFGGRYDNWAGFFALGGARVIPTMNGMANLPLSFIVGPGGPTAGGAGAGRYVGFGYCLIPPYCYGNYTFYSARNFGNFPIGATGVAGVQLGSGDYGWIRLRLDDLGPNRPFGGGVGDGHGFPDRVTIIDWAYDDSGAPIHVADTGVSQVPEPSSLVLLASGAAGLAAFRRRKAERRV